MRIYTINNKRVFDLQKNTKRRWWKEGMSYDDIKRFKEDILELWTQGQVRYWKVADSYILHNFESKVPFYFVYCITKPFFHSYFKI